MQICCRIIITESWWEWQINASIIWNRMAVRFQMSSGIVLMRAMYRHREKTKRKTKNKNRMIWTTETISDGSKRPGYRGHAQRPRRRRGLILLIVEFLDLWDLLLEVEPQPEVEDSHTWCFSTNGKYLAKSAYESLFVGAVLFRPLERFWKKLGAPEVQVLHVVGHS
jgi:hypothetical protein